MIPISRKMIILNKHKMVNIHKLSIQKVILKVVHVQTGKCRPQSHVSFELCSL